MSSSAGHLEPLDNLQRRVQSITSLSLLEKSQLINLLSELSE